MPIHAVVCDLVCALAFLAEPSPVNIVIEDDPAAASRQARTAIPAVAGSDQSTGRPLERTQPSERLHQNSVVVQLQIQSALRQGRELVKQGRYDEALRQMEPLLAHVDGCETYLETLVIAYRGQIGALMKERRLGEARLLAERLRILSPQDQPNIEVAASPADESPQDLAAADRIGSTAAAEVDSTIQPAASGFAQMLPRALAAASRDVLPTGVVVGAPTKPAYEARGKIEDQPLLSTSADGKKSVVSSLAQAEKIYKEKRYADALTLYEQAYEEDANGVQVARERWGYCLLYVSVKRYNELLDRPHTEVSDVELANLEADLKLARKLDPSLEYTDTALTALEQLKKARAKQGTAKPVSASSGGGQAQTTRAAAAEQVAVRHLAQERNWSVAETTNFRIYHRDRQLAEQIGQLAEQARRYSHEKWFGGEALENWSPKCEVFLYPTAQEYTQSTGVPLQSPGHSKVLNDGGRILGRKLELRTDDPSLQEAILPHEVTHVVLAGRFGSATLPRWADEGMAVLTEPRVKQEGHISNLLQTHRNRNGFTCAQLMTMGDYPSGGQMRDFYAHSVGLCRYLVEKGGADKLVAFMRLSLRTNNYESALQQVYGMQNFAELETGFAGYLSTMGSAVANAQ